MKPAQTAATPPPLSAMTPVSAGPGGCISRNDSDQWRAPPNTAELSPGREAAAQSIYGAALSILEMQDH
jgi:hypothetical protein